MQLCVTIYVGTQQTDVSDMHIGLFSLGADWEQRSLQIWSDTSIKLESAGTWKEICQLETQTFIIFYLKQRPWTFFWFWN